MTYTGGERRREVTSPVRARRRAVTPEVLKHVKGIELRARNLVNTLFTGEYRSVFRGQGIEFAEVREYQQGDDFRAIDWNVSARMGHPFVKTFMEERELTLLLIVDQSGSLHFGRPYTKAGLAVEVAAVLALAAARHNDRVGALLFADTPEYVVRPAKGRAHALRVIRDLVAFAPRGRGTSLAGALRYATKLLRHRAIVVVLSDFRAEGWEEALGQVAARHEVVAITVDDPREYQLPDAGWVELEDAETGQRLLVDTSHAPTRLRIRVAAERLQQESGWSARSRRPPGGGCGSRNSIPGRRRSRWVTPSSCGWRVAGPCAIPSWRGCPVWSRRRCRRCGGWALTAAPIPFPAGRPRSASPASFRTACRLPRRGPRWRPCGCRAARRGRRWRACCCPRGCSWRSSRGGAAARARC